MKITQSALLLLTSLVSVVTADEKVRLTPPVPDTPGLSVSADGCITGSLAEAGEHVVTLKAGNSLGSTTRTLKGLEARIPSYGVHCVRLISRR